MLSVAALNRCCALAAALDLELALSPSVARIIVSAGLSGCSGAELGMCVQHSVSIEMSLKKGW